MKPKQIIVSVLVASLFIIPKEFFFKPDNFWMDMALNVAGFLIGAVAGALFFMKKENVPEENKSVKTEIPLPPLPGATKSEDYNKYMPK
jgi:membrane associated rhomboid family serine protease